MEKSMNSEERSGSVVRISRGEARIRRAFLISAGVIAVVAAAGAAVYWLTRQPVRAPAVEDAEITTPTVPRQALPA
jgi:negative regulator of sigma E activity